MPHFLNFPCWKCSTWSGDSRGAWGQTTPRRKITFVPGMCVPGGSEGKKAGGALVCPGNSQLWVSELPGFPWEGFFLQLHLGPGIFPLMWESQVRGSHSLQGRCSGIREASRDGRAVGTTKLCPWRSSQDASRTLERSRSR